MIPQVTNHLWQSTLFTVAVGLLTIAFRKNRATVRYWLWFSASFKFFVPFALLMSLGSHLGWAPAADKISTEGVSFTVVQIAQPFPDTLPFVSPAHGARDWVPIGIPGVWACGFIAISLIRFRDWLRIRAMVRSSTPIDIPAPVNARSTPSLLEPGVVGWLRPILVLPAGIADRLTPPQFAAVLAHELCHVRRRDNLFSSIHMVVEAVFWFHPLIWWIGARLLEERERACDEEVLRTGSEPQIYAEGILNVCKLYVESPIKCVSGVTGSNLKRRVESIMSNRTGQSLTRAKKLLLAGAGVVALAGPLVIGLGQAPVIRAQSGLTQNASARSEKPLAFDAASIKPSNIGGGGRKGGPGGGSLQITPPGRVFGRSVSAKRIIREAYHLTDDQVSGGPGWIDSDRFTLEAKAESPADKNQLRQMLQTLLRDRFGLGIHRETKEMPVYTLTIAKSGLKVHELKEGTPTPTSVARTRGAGPGPAIIFRGSMQEFADLLSDNPSIGRPVVDKTGLQEIYFFGVAWGEDEDFVTVIQEEFGLKLESRKAPMDVLVVDRIEKPSEN